MWLWMESSTIKDIIETSDKTWMGSENEMVVMIIFWFPWLKYGHFWKYHWRFFSSVFHEIKPSQSLIFRFETKETADKIVRTKLKSISQTVWSIQRNDILPMSLAKRKYTWFSAPPVLYLVYIIPHSPKLKSYPFRRRFKSDDKYYRVWFIPKCNGI